MKKSDNTFAVFDRHAGRIVALYGTQEQASARAQTLTAEANKAGGIPPGTNGFPRYTVRNLSMGRLRHG